jgi:hypothetical protein
LPLPPLLLLLLLLLLCQVTHVVSQSDVVKLLWANKAVLSEALGQTVEQLELDDVSCGGQHYFDETGMRHVKDKHETRTSKDIRYGVGMQLPTYDPVPLKICKHLYICTKLQLVGYQA